MAATKKKAPAKKAPAKKEEPVVIEPAPPSSVPGDPAEEFAPGVIPGPGEERPRVTQPPQPTPAPPSEGE